MSSPLRLSRPLVTASLLVPALLYLAYRWQKTREQVSCHALKLEQGKNVAAIIVYGLADCGTAANWAPI